MWTRLPPWRWLSWLVLTLVTLCLNFLWEMLQAPMYEGMMTAPRWIAVRSCGVASIGDAVLTLLAYGSVAAWVRDGEWLDTPRGGRVAAFLVIGLGLTIVLEGLNVYVWQRWAYAQAMPQVFGIGATPLAQWLVVPPVSLWLARILLRSSRRHVPQGPQNSH
ncbi:MAG: hypothetical protein M3081_12595 [Gemmatimonadota bacterium]|nr:hypothetical protein [Gemmatimonadota bacterium]